MAENQETTCEKVEDVIMRSFDPDLFKIKPQEKVLAEAHLKVCQKCRDFNRLFLTQRIKARIAETFRKEKGEEEMQEINFGLPFHLDK